MRDSRASCGGRAAAARYLGSLLRGRPEHHAGHNPAGALAIVALLGLALAVVASGWATYNDLVGGWLEDAHEAVATGMLALVGVHVAGVLLGSWLHRENLIRAMITGRKPVGPDEGIRQRVACGGGADAGGGAGLLVAAVAGRRGGRWIRRSPVAAAKAALRDA